MKGVHLKRKLKYTEKDEVVAIYSRLPHHHPYTRYIIVSVITEMSNYTTSKIKSQKNLVLREIC